MDAKNTDAAMIGSILLSESVFAEYSEGSPEVLPEIYPNKNGLNDSEYINGTLRQRKIFSEILRMSTANILFRF